MKCIQINMMCFMPLHKFGRKIILFAIKGKLFKKNVFICTLSKMAASYDVMKNYKITHCRIKRIYHCIGRYTVYVKLLAIRLFY